MAVEWRNCFACDRQIRSADTWCVPCQQKWPTTWAQVVAGNPADIPAVQTLVDINLRAMFSDDPFEQTGGLLRADSHGH